MTPTARIGALGSLAIAACVVAGCGGSKAQPIVPTVPAARTFSLADFKPAVLRPGKPEDLSFTIRQPSGDPLTSYRSGRGPHTGVHLIIVRDDLSTIVHRHPPVGSDGRLSQAITFSGPGRYRIVVDAYPNLSSGQRNFQLFKTVQVGHGDPKAALPASRGAETVDGYRFTVHGADALRALTPAFLTITVRDPKGRPARFTPYYGALAHAIFFARGSLDYFHTHVCGPSTPGCTSVLGGARVRGVSTTPGKLTVGVLVPLPGTWRLFLQVQVGNRVLTAPFTLRVR